MNEEKRLMGGGGRLLRVILILMKVKVIKVMKAEGRTISKGGKQMKLLLKTIFSLNNGDQKIYSVFLNLTAATPHPHNWTLLIVG